MTSYLQQFRFCIIGVINDINNKMSKVHVEQQLMTLELSDVVFRSEKLGGVFQTYTHVYHQQLCFLKVK